jgi:hypothetical protein
MISASKRYIHSQLRRLAGPCSHDMACPLATLLSAPFRMCLLPTHQSAALPTFLEAKSVRPWLTGLIYQPISFPEYDIENAQHSRTYSIVHDMWALAAAASNRAVAPKPRIQGPVLSYYKTGYAVNTLDAEEGARRTTSLSAYCVGSYIIQVFDKLKADTTCRRSRAASPNGGPSS